MTAPATPPATAPAPTPGPYEAKPSCFGRRISALDGETLALVFETADGRGPANAALFAASPDLLDIADRWLALHDGTWDDLSKVRELPALLAATAAAAAKARTLS